MIRRAFSLLLRLPLPGVLAAGLLLLAAVAGHVPAAWAEELVAKAEASAAQVEAASTQAEAGRGALRPYVHVLAAYGIAWVLVCAWTWRIAKGLKRVEEELEQGAGARG